MTKEVIMKLEVNKEIQDLIGVDVVQIHRVDKGNRIMSVMFELLYKGQSVNKKELENAVSVNLTDYHWDFNGKGWTNYCLTLENGKVLKLETEKPNYFNNTVTKLEEEWHVDFKNFFKTGEIPNFEELELKRRKSDKEFIQHLREIGEWSCEDEKVLNQVHSMIK